MYCRLMCFHVVSLQNHPTNPNSFASSGTPTCPVRYTTLIQLALAPVGGAQSGQKSIGFSFDTASVLKSIRLEH